MKDPFDIDLNDDELDAEILLLTHLMVAASESDRRLSQAAIDTILTNPTAGGGATHHIQATGRGTPDTWVPAPGDSHDALPSPSVPQPRHRCLASGTKLAHETEPRAGRTVGPRPRAWPNLHDL
jgi:hypothetical protein